MGTSSTKLEGLSALLRSLAFLWLSAVASQCPILTDAEKKLELLDTTDILDWVKFTFSVPHIQTLTNGFLPC